ncbi:MAG: PHP domain-containing protein [Gammaproteobacteria bacterium]|nr:PHP domain-containing protein [Gammaproteobacteria bacterium]
MPNKSPKTAIKPSKKPFWRKGRIIKYSVILILLALIFSFSPLVIPTSNLTPSQAAQARSGAAKILKPLMSSREDVSISVTAEHLEAISNAVSYTVPAVQLRLNSSSYGILIASSLTTVPGVVYVNFSCWLMPDFNGTMTFSQCKLGSLPVPGKLIEYFAKGLARLLFGEEALTTLNNILSNTQLENNQVVVRFKKPGNLKAAVEQRLTDTFKMVQDLRQINGVETDTIQTYLDFIQSHSERTATTAEMVGKTFLLAKTRSASEDPTDENFAALWALAMSFGSPDFARIVAMPVDYSVMQPKKYVLRGRMDLRLHFFYSVALRLASEKQMSINIGKLKEVMDSAKGGSGYSFRDLTADKAGVELADFAISSDSNARRVQEVLAGIDSESQFVPLLHDLPEGLSEETFASAFGSESDPRYQEMEARIDDRIQALPVYSNNTPQRQQTITSATYDRPANAGQITQSGNWYQVDTHTHTRFSDGRFSITQLAENASKFGCDAIAITDHGDHNLKGVFSAEYWQDFANASSQFNDLTLIAGLEWNIPPFAGREHMTLLFPESMNHDRLISLFRDRYDHYGKTKSTTIDESQALEWLNNQFKDSETPPVVMYNHPSRKDLEPGENAHDMRKWRSQTPYVIGFSGAPGHQKKRGEDNGSYNNRFKTRHGWDPAVAIPGNDWDTLLQAGLQTFAARAPSDFHNTRMDYWPCEFSTTHVYASSRRTNDLLDGFASGNYWAQHGKFVASLSAQVQNDNGQAIAQAGNVINSPRLPLTARLTVTLNKEDWQGFKTSLDEVTAVIVTEIGMQTEVFFPDPQRREQSFEVRLPANANITAVRWFGRSIQPEQHHYQFFTNPVMIHWQ